MRIFQLSPSRISTHEYVLPTFFEPLLRTVSVHLPLELTSSLTETLSSQLVVSLKVLLRIFQVSPSRTIIHVKLPTRLLGALPDG
jgi:hypothetical protein